jgi:hypothetical protein
LFSSPACHADEPASETAGSPHLRRDWARPCHIGIRTRLTAARSVPGLGSPPATSAPGLGSPLPHLRRDWARPCHICAGTGLAAATSAPGLGLAAATSASGPGSPQPHLYRDVTHCCHGNTPPTHKRRIGGDTKATGTPGGTGHVVLSALLPTLATGCAPCIRMRRAFLCCDGPRSLLVEWLSQRRCFSAGGVQCCGGRRLLSSSVVRGHCELTRTSLWHSALQCTSPLAPQTHARTHAHMHARTVAGVSPVAMQTWQG